jgi:hypothetical protein
MKYLKITTSTCAVDYHEKKSTFYHAMVISNRDVPVPDDFISSPEKIDQIRKRIEEDGREWANMEWIKTEAGQSWIMNL